MGPIPYKQRKLTRYIAILVIVAFTGSMLRVPPVYAQDAFQLPVAGTRVNLSPSFNPPVLKGLKIHVDDPFRFDFILDKGASNLAGQALKDESAKLIKYFLASITVPEEDLWVNLSPYEKERIVPESFGQTEMGRDLLAEDYMLKQVTASLIYPEDEFGKQFWQRVYAEAQKQFGTTQVPVNTFNKVWIVPQKAVVYENAKAGTAYVVESKLKVMLEEDYLAQQKAAGSGWPAGGSPTRPQPEARTGRVPQGQDPLPSGVGEATQVSTVTTNQPTQNIGNQIVRDIVIPKLEEEVNKGKNFARLRQVYQSLILATWYKQKLKDSILAKVYADKNMIQGLKLKAPQVSTVTPHQPSNILGQGPNDIESIYQQYLKAFKKGVYNYIKEEHDPVTQKTISRKYFSGGVIFGMEASRAMSVTGDEAVIKPSNDDYDRATIVHMKLDPVLGLADPAMNTQAIKAFLSQYPGDYAPSLKRERRPAVTKAMLDEFGITAAQLTAYLRDMSLKDALKRTRQRDEYNSKQQILAIERALREHDKTNFLNQHPEYRGDISKFTAEQRRNFIVKDFNKIMRLEIQARTSSIVGIRLAVWVPLDSQQVTLNWALKEPMKKKIRQAIYQKQERDIESIREHYKQLSQEDFFTYVQSAILPKQAPAVTMFSQANRAMNAVAASDQGSSIFDLIKDQERKAKELIDEWNGRDAAGKAAMLDVDYFHQEIMSKYYPVDRELLMYALYDDDFNNRRKITKVNNSSVLGMGNPRARSMPIGYILEHLSRPWLSLDRYKILPRLSAGSDFKEKYAFRNKRIALMALLIERVQRYSYEMGDEYDKEDINREKGGYDNQSYVVLIRQFLKEQIEKEAGQWEKDLDNKAAQLIKAVGENPDFVLGERRPMTFWEVYITEMIRYQWKTKVLGQEDTTHAFLYRNIYVDATYFQRSIMSHFQEIIASDEANRVIAGLTRRVDAIAGQTSSPVMTVKQVQQFPVDQGVKTLKNGDIAKAATAATGGIDFNAVDGRMQVQNRDGGIKINMHPAILQRLQGASGFRPVVIGIQPLLDLQVFLGIQKPAKE